MGFVLPIAINDSTHSPKTAHGDETLVYG